MDTVDADVVIIGGGIGRLSKARRILAGKMLPPIPSSTRVPCTYPESRIRWRTPHNRHCYCFPVVDVVLVALNAIHLSPKHGIL